MYEDSEYPTVASEENNEKFNKLMDVFVKYRDAIKNNAKAEDAAKLIFKLSDEVRDDILPQLGI